MPTRRALVIGAGVGGLATTYRLLRSDWDVVVLEPPAQPLPTGLPTTLTDFGVDAARRLGLLPALVRRRQPRCDLVEVDATGLPLAVRPRPSARNPAVTEHDVLAVLDDAIGGAASRRREDLPVLLADDCGVTAVSPNGDTDWFDVVVGADGACADIGDAVFPDTCDAPRPRWSTVSRPIGMASSCAVSMDLVTRTIRLHPLRDGGSAVSFAWRDLPGVHWPEQFADLGWLVPSLLSHVDGVPCAPVVRAWPGRWTHRQLALLGDSAWHLGPHAGRGISLSIGGAELLGDALDIFPDGAEALSWWERTVRPYVRRARIRPRGLGDREPKRDSPGAASADVKR
ncbi:FAD-dependent oxidoreductase [Lentzea xinjiangensis]|nr:FAD-dependent monooxygenase [Lentzea xinjiangensis]